MRTMLALAALALPCLADEVVLKDGRRIEWKSIEDSGDNAYVLVTPEGNRITLKRTDVESFAKTEHVSALTGASMTFDKKVKLDVNDLLRKVESEKDYLSGAWKALADGTLQCARPAQISTSRVQARHAPTSDEYNLTATVERVEDGDNIGFGLIAPGGNRCTFVFDLENGTESGLLLPDQKREGVVKGKQFSPKKPRTVTFMVRKAGLVVQLDGKDFSTIRTDWSKVAPYPGVGPNDQGFSIAALTTGVKVSRWMVSYPAPVK